MEKERLGLQAKQKLKKWMEGEGKFNNLSLAKYHIASSCASAFSVSYVAHLMKSGSRI